ncbi:DUF4134 family protein [Runella limosa]|uniref:DUF4134 family protein n=1 Tax=Runella limosa TaxID=370978 RepID=UPI0004003488|nr:DUF4134 family protein [Runella limosa]
MDALYGYFKQIAYWACAAAGVVAGFKIYMRWNRGEQITHQLFSWIVSLSSVGAIVYAVETYIYGSGLQGGLAIGWAGLLATELYEVVMLFGLVVSIVSVIRIYTKYTEGEDIVPLIYQWVGSLLFLGMLGLIVETFIG